jgi:amidase
MTNGVSELATSSAEELRRLVTSGKVSPREMAGAFLARIHAADSQIGAFVTMDEVKTLAMADDVARRLKNGENLPLAGVPYALKDLTETKGLRTTFGSKSRKDFVPDRDAAIARRLREAGGILLGKTNTPEFGNRATTAFGLFPATRNPWDVAKTAGGSSGGSAAAVAACLAPVAEGSDGGGSIRIPSSCCGVVGLKPSRGRVSNAPNSNPRGGLITHGPITRSVRDAALLLDIMAGPEPGDPFSAPPPAVPFLESTDRDPKRLRIGCVTACDKWIDPQVMAAVKQAATLISSIGHVVEEVSVDLTGLGDAFRVMVESESAATDIATAEMFSDPYSRWCYEKGSKRTAVEYIRASEEMIRRSREIIATTAEWDCLITPTVTLLPQDVETFLADTEKVADDDLAYIPFTYPFNISGQPAISLPLGWSETGLPIGVQLVGRPFGEYQIIGLAAQIERAKPWAARFPAGGGPE